MKYLILLNLTTAFIALIVLSMKRHPLFALIAFCVTLLYSWGIWYAGLNLEERLCTMLYAEERYGIDKGLPAAMGGWTALILSNVCMAIYPWLKRWAVVIWGFTFLSVGLGVGMLSPLNIVEGLYAVCCAIMMEIAVMTGLTYLEACTLENIYLHSLLPTIFALPALITSINTVIKRRKACFRFILSCMWFLLNLIMTVSVWFHYLGLPLENAGRKCVGELRALSGYTWSGYVAVNLIIFVILFLTNAFVSWTLYRLSKNAVRDKSKIHFVH